MAEENAPQEDRTEAATPRRRERAREEGNVPASRELTTFVGLAAVMLTWSMLSPAVLPAATARLSIFLARADASALPGPEAFRLFWAAALPVLGPCILAAVIGGAGATLLQTRFLISGSSLRPKFQRVDPRAGLARLFGVENLLDTLKAVIRVGLVGVALTVLFRRDLAVFGTLPWRDPRMMADFIGARLTPVALVVLAVQGLIAGFEVFWVYYRHIRQLRMTRQEIIDETKDSDGDPALRARIRQIRRKRAGKRMLAEVPKSIVVITNPTHYAVALAYDRDRTAAPRVVAKGIDAMAARIRELAQDHRVPLMANPPLARALYKVELDTEVPAELYQAVAEVVSYVMRLNTAARRRG